MIVCSAGTAVVTSFSVSSDNEHTHAAFAEGQRVAYISIQLECLTQLCTLF
eukprot:SAG11_NODE_3192_length_2622_cov_1.761395_2_plen_51_part_00